MNKSILLIHPYFGFGGAEKIIIFLANSLSLKYKVHLAIFRNDDINLKLNSSVVLHKVLISRKDGSVKSMGILNTIIYFISVIKNIRLLLSSIKPSAAMAIEDRFSLLLWIATRGTKYPTVFSQRSDPFNKSFLWKMITKFIYSRSSGVVFQTYGAFNFYKPHKSFFSVIPNPAIKREYVGQINTLIDLPDRFIMAGGRFLYRKGFDLLIDAFYLVTKLYTDYKLVIFGDGIEMNKLKNQVSDLGLEDYVIFPGKVDNVMQHSSKAIMFVLPSRSEGVPNILIEAMVAGLPCISTDCSPGGARLILNNGECGLLVENNNENKLAEAIIKYIENDDLKILMMRKSIEWIEHFNEEKVVDQWLHFFEKLMI